MNKKTFFAASFVVALVAVGTFAPTAQALHSWGDYHWARNANPFALKVGDNLTQNWKPFLGTASSEWSKSSVLDTVLVAGTALRHKSSSRDCSPVSGRVEVCNKTYGNNGWLGIASIWASGSHITQGTVKLNDSYFNTAKYNTPAWRNLVMCQEIGHTFGLDHQDGIFTNANLGTCMDYTNDPSTNQFPNPHDYDMLGTIYSHLDSGTTVSQTPSSNKQQVDHADPSTWGKRIRTSSDGRGSLYERDFGNGKKIFTFVIWAT